MRTPNTLLTLSLIFLASLPSAHAAETRQATGVKVGEVTDQSAIIWTRATAHAERQEGPIGKLPLDRSIEELEGACPGSPRRVRVRYGLRENLSDAREMAWVSVLPATDYSHQFRLEGLKPATVYYYATETAGPPGEPGYDPLRGKFETAPKADERAAVSFTVITGQAYRTMDDRKGHLIYDSMLKLRPKFMVSTGDTVYYDNDTPNAYTVGLARHHWHRIYSLPRIRAFHLEVPGYWEKDDHDTLKNDCWPKKPVEPVEAESLKPETPLNFDIGCHLFREQAPMGEKTHRTFRWGKGLQIWLPEGRDFRSPNRDPDGPEKTIWGKEQKAWLMKTLAESDAEWKVLVSPTPIVGPDRGRKSDNHANATWATESLEFRRWAKENVKGNFFIVCGDRHWQYHSVDPETGIHELCGGPASNRHAEGSPGLDPDFHRFHQVKGGFLSVNVSYEGDRSKLVFRIHEVDGKAAYEFAPEAGN